LIIDEGPEDNEVVVSVFLGNYHNFFQRIWIAAKYVLRQPCENGHWDNFLLEPSDIERLVGMLKECQKLTFQDNSRHEFKQFYTYEENTIKFVLDKDPEYPMLYSLIFLKDHDSFFRRMSAGIKYVFGYKCRYGYFDDITFTRSDIDQLIDIVNEYCEIAKNSKFCKSRFEK
jgi:AAA15 family ATPase/GTPase